MNNIYLLKYEKTDIMNEQFIIKKIAGFNFHTS